MHVTKDLIGQPCTLRPEARVTRGCLRKLRLQNPRTFIIEEAKLGAQLVQAIVISGRLKKVKHGLY